MTALRSTRSTGPHDRPTFSAWPSSCGDALWRVESAAIEPIDTPGGLIVAGMGGSAIGGRAGPRGARRPGLAPDPAGRGYGLPSWTTPETTVLCASYSGNTEETLACYESAGALGARRIVVTSGGRLARAGARRRGRGDPDPRRLSAARGDRLPARQSRSRSPRCAAPGRAWPPRSTSRRPTSRSSPRSGDPTPPRTRGAQGARAGAARHVAGDRRRRADRRARLPLEDADQREREAAGVRGRDPRARPQRDRRLEGAATLAPFSAVFLDDWRQPPAAAQADRADRELHRAARAFHRVVARVARARSSGSAHSCCSAICSPATWRP